MERLVLMAQLRGALTAHELWRSKLTSAVLTGRRDFSASEVRRTDACEFGRWLARIGDLPEVPQVAAVRLLHDRFHEEAGAVLELFEAKLRGEAMSALGPGGRFDEASLRLSSAMRDWIAAL